MKIALTGANGFLGKKLMSYFAGATGFTRKDFDLCDAKGMTQVLDPADFDVLIHTAALTDVKDCETQKEQALAVNLHASAGLAVHCDMRDKKFVFVSTDYVFSGREGSYSVSAAVDPINFYGRTKALAEEYVARISRDWIILRVPILYGVNDSEDKMTFPRYVIESLRAGKTIEADNRRIKFPALIDDVAAAIEKLVAMDFRGIAHFPGDVRGLTRYEWAKEIARELGFDERAIVARDEGDEPPRPEKVMLESGISFKVTTVSEGIRGLGI